jgi:prophage antirepressor-like protein
MADFNSHAVFAFHDHSVRVITRDGEPWFVAKDVCDALSYSNSRGALADHLDADEKGVANADTPGGQQQMQIINESGLYALVLRSRKPEARKFAKWVTAEVLPAIRKTGRYEAPGKEMTVNDMVDKMTRLLGTGNSYPPILFMPLVNAVMRKQGYTFFLPHQQAQEVTERLERLSLVFHPHSQQASDVFAIGRALRGLNPKTGTADANYRQVLPACGSSVALKQAALQLG